MLVKTEEGVFELRKRVKHHGYAVFSRYVAEQEIVESLYGVVSQIIC